MKTVFVLMPMQLPKLTDRAAADVIDVLQYLLASSQHHYAPQIARWQRRQRSQRRIESDRARRNNPPSPFDADVPF